MTDGSHFPFLVDETHLCSDCTYRMPLTRCTHCLDLFWCCFACTGETPEITFCWPCEREQRREVPYAWS